MRETITSILIKTELTVVETTNEEEYLKCKLVATYFSSLFWGSLLIMGGYNTVSAMIQTVLICLTLLIIIIYKTSTMISTALSRNHHKPNFLMIKMSIVEYLMVLGTLAMIIWFWYINVELLRYLITFVSVMNFTHIVSDMIYDLLAPINQCRTSFDNKSNSIHYQKRQQTDNHHIIVSDDESCNSTLTRPLTAMTRQSYSNDFEEFYKSLKRKDTTISQKSQESDTKSVKRRFDAFYQSLKRQDTIKSQECDRKSIKSRNNVVFSLVDYFYKPIGGYISDASLFSEYFKFEGVGKISWKKW
jgi:hypothetical protein